MEAVAMSRYKREYLFVNDLHVGQTFPDASH
jgi:hypothetical protein